MKRFLKVVGFSLLVLLVLAGGFAYYLKNNIKELVMHRLLSEVEATFGHYYHITYDTLDISLDNWQLGISIKNPVFSTDTTLTAYRSKYPPVFFKAQQLSIQKINVQKLMFMEQIDIRRINLEHPELLFFTHTLSKQSQEQKAVSKKEARKLIQEIRLEELVVSKGNIHFIPYENQSKTLFYGEEIAIRIHKARLFPLDSQGLLQSSKIDNLQFAMKNVKCDGLNSSYAFVMKQMDLDLKANEIKLRGTSMVPQTSLIALSRNHKYQKTFAKMDIGNIHIKGLDFKKLLNKELNIQSLEIADASFVLLKNKEKLLNKSIRKSTFQEIINNINVPIKIEALKLKNLFLTFKLQFPNHPQPAIIQLKNINGTVSEINNYKGQKKTIHLNAKATIMKTGKLQFSATIPLHAKDHLFNGTITNMPFHEWNQVISMVAPVQIESGNIKKVTFKGIAKPMESNGTLVFEYSDLKAAVYRKNKSNTLKKSKLLSFSANQVIRTDNPAKGETKAEPVPFHFEREPYQGQVMLWIGGIMDGMGAHMFPDIVKNKMDEKLKEKRKRRIR